MIPRSAHQLALKKKNGARPGPTLRIPSAEHYPPIRRIVLDGIHHPRELIHSFPLIIILARPVLCPEMAPLEPIHWAQIAYPPMSQSDLIEVLSRSVSFPYIHALVR